MAPATRAKSLKSMADKPKSDGEIISSAAASGSGIDEATDANIGGETGGEKTGDTGGGPGSEIFPFFDLPRELRDHVYGELLKERTYEYINQCKLSFVAHNRAVPQFLTINRQFGAEYKDAAREKGVLGIHDTGYELPPLVNRPLLDVIKPFRTLHINIADAVRTANRRHFPWMLEVFQRPEVKKVSVKMVWSAYHMQFGSVEEVMSNCACLAKLENVTGFEVFAEDTRFDKCWFRKQDRRILKWSAKRQEFDKFAPEGIPSNVAEQLKRLEG